MNCSDAELLESVTTGDEDAFKVLMDMHGSRVYGFALRAVGNAADAEDITQETFIEVLKSAGRFDGRVTAVPWLLGIAANRCRMLMRRQGRSEVPLDTLPADSAALSSDAQSNPQPVGSSHEAHYGIRLAVKGLPANYRLPIILRFQHGLRDREIAQALGISRSAAAKRMSRALAMLRERLSHLGESE